MSVATIRSSFETALLAVAPTFATAWENTNYAPIVGTPYQQVALLLAQPANPEIGPGYIEQGIFQVNGFFPKDTGPATATAWAEAIRAAFPFGTSLSGGVSVNATPEIGPARPEDDRFMVPVKVRWSARIGS